MNRPHISALGAIGFHVNALIAAGHGSDVSADQVMAGLHDGSLPQVLNDAVPATDWTSQFRPGVIDVLAYSSEGSRPRDLAIPDSAGLNWLLGLIIEALQQGFWTRD